MDENSNTALDAPIPDHGSIEAPSKVLMMPYLVHHWANLSIIPILRQRFGTTFVIYVSGQRNIERYQPSLTPGDSILSLEDLTSAPSQSPGEAEVFQTARRNEARYGICYMRDVLQMDRRVFTSASGVAPNSNFGGAAPFDPVVTYHKVNVLFDRIEDLFTQRRFDLVLGWPISLHDACCTYVARRRGVLVTHPYPAKLENRVFWATGPFVTSEQHRTAYDEAGSRTRTDGEPLKLAAPAKPVNLDAGKVSSLYSTKKTTELVVRALIDRVSFYIGDFKKRRIPWRVNRLSLYTVVKNPIRSWIFFKKFIPMCHANLEEISRQPFVFYAFHQEPEFTVQAQAKDFNDQAAIVKQFAKSLPAGVNLVIKEHATIGNRPIGYYEELIRFPNVIMAHPDIAGIELVRRGVAVASLRGTVTLEAALLGKPALVFVSDTEFSVLPNVRFVPSFHAARDVLAWATGPLADEERLAFREAGLRFREAVFNISFAAQPLFSKDGSLLEAPDANRAVDLLAQLFRRFNAGSRLAKETTSGSPA